MSFRNIISKLSIFFVLTVFLSACGGGGGGEQQTSMQEQQATTPSATGSVEYTANFEGDQPKRAEHDASGNPECGVDKVLGEKIVVNDNQTLRDLVVSVDEGPSGYEQPAEEVVIDQKNCRYDPHVVTVKAGQTVKVTDSDPNMHNVRATQDGEQLFNLTTFKGDEKEVTFEDPGYVRLECNIHPWMEAWVYVTEHGKAKVTGEDGKATLNDLPTGDYTLETWHEELDSKEHSATVEENQTTTVSGTFQ